MAQQFQDDVGWQSAKSLTSRFAIVSRLALAAAAACASARLTAMELRTSRCVSSSVSSSTTVA